MGLCRLSYLGIFEKPLFCGPLLSVVLAELGETGWAHLTKWGAFGVSRDTVKEMWWVGVVDKASTWPFRCGIWGAGIADYRKLLSRCRLSTWSF